MSSRAVEELLRKSRFWQGGEVFSSADLQSVTSANKTVKTISARRASQILQVMAGNGELDVFNDRGGSGGNRVRYKKAGHSEFARKPWRTMTNQAIGVFPDRLGSHYDA